jgi:23S rRNA (adenine2503-C2)-methyltransferase
LGCTQAEMADLFAALGLPTFRAKQVFNALFARRVESFLSMTELSRPLRESLQAQFDLGRPRIDACQVSVDGTRKYRFVAADGTAFESVYIPEVGGKRTNTLCISSQSGCAVGCKFCFTASLKRNRNLSAAEIVGQVLAVQNDVTPLGEAALVTNIVFMGMGEPFLNFVAVTQACRLLLDPKGMGFSGRRITISTSGIVPRIRQLAELSKSGELPVQLAISLNATTDAIRTQIMPINKKWNLEALLGSLRDFPLQPRRRFTIEYVLLGGINDSLDDAKRLCTLLQGLPVKVNLLPLNPHDQTPFVPPTDAAVRLFQGHLRRSGLHALVRTARGQDIAAACGQLGESMPPQTPANARPRVPVASQAKAKLPVMQPAPAPPVVLDSP